MSWELVAQLIVLMLAALIVVLAIINALKGDRVNRRDW